MHKIQHTFQCITSTARKSSMFIPQNSSSTGQILLRISFLKGTNNSFWENELWTYSNENSQNKTSTPNTHTPNTQYTTPNTSKTQRFINYKNNERTKDRNTKERNHRSLLAWKSLRQGMIQFNYTKFSANCLWSEMCGAGWEPVGVRLSVTRSSNCREAEIPERRV